MKKDVKVITINAKMNNGHNRTVQAIAPLDMTATDIIKMKNIPALSIVSTKETAPMTVQEAARCLIRDHLANIFAPNVKPVKSTFSVIYC